MTTISKGRCQCSILPLSVFSFSWRYYLVLTQSGDYLRHVFCGKRKLLWNNNVHSAISGVHLFGLSSHPLSYCYLHSYYCQAMDITGSLCSFTPGRVQTYDWITWDWLLLFWLQYSSQPYREVSQLWESDDITRCLARSLSHSLGLEPTMAGELVNSLTKVANLAINNPCLCKGKILWAVHASWSNGHFVLRGQLIQHARVYYIIILYI